MPTLNDNPSDSYPNRFTRRRLFSRRYLLQSLTAIRKSSMQGICFSAEYSHI